MSFTIEAVVNIEEDRRLIVQLPTDVPVGTHHVRATVDPEPATPAPSDASRDWVFPVLPIAQWPADLDLTREGMYDNDGR